MRKKTGILTFIVVATAMCFNGTTLAQEVTEHPLIRPFPGAVLHERSSVYNNFDEYDFQVKDPRTGRADRRTVGGEYRRLLYYLHREDGSRNTSVSRVEYFENFKIAAIEKGGKIEWEDARGLVFTIRREDGGLIWCRVEASVGAGSTTLIIVDEKPLVTSLEFTSAQMMAALDADGKIALYGILFDFDKATLQQFSSKQLQQVLTLLIQNPELRLEIQGHTDSDGSEAYNRQLSQRRAESVLNYLVLFGVDTSRLQARGYGEARPVAPNDTDETPQKLSDITSPYTVVVFGAGWCPACHDDLSSLAGLYKKWERHNIEVVFVSLDKDNKAFRNFAGSFPFISICDYQKWESPIVQDYHVFATPTMYLLDSNREILLRPHSVRQMDAWVDWFLVQGNL